MSTRARALVLCFLFLSLAAYYSFNLGNDDKYVSEADQQASLSSLLSWENSKSGPPPPATPDPITTNDNNAGGAADGAEKGACPTLPGAEDVLLVMKTGATEIYQKLPIHLATHFRCTDDLLIFSDLAQDIGAQHVYDALEGISPVTKANNLEFKPYEIFKKYQAVGGDLSELRSNTESWWLDKWKFLPMLKRTVELRPQYKWYIFIEADTSMSWTNLLQLLSRLDATKPTYFGAQIEQEGNAFAHGGSGYVLSKPALDRLAAKWSDDWLQKWEQTTALACCGDLVVGMAMKELGIEVNQAVPVVQGVRVTTLDWTATHWKAPVVTWHHMSAHDIDVMWQFEQAWIREKGPTTPYLMRDVFAHFVAPHLVADLEDWNNLSQDIVYEKTSADEDESWRSTSDDNQKAIHDPTACQFACQENEQCVQWTYQPNRCALGKVIRFGKHVAPDEYGYRSGWILDRVEDFRNKQEPVKPNWGFRQ